jgi:hypothetical protein
MTPADQKSTPAQSTVAEMGDERHKAKHPEGPRIEMTPAWKQRVRDRLKENKAKGIYPRNQVELAEAVGASDKSGITKMFKADGSVFVPDVCRVLNLPMPMQEYQEDDELDELTKSFNKEDRERALQILRIAMKR